MYVYSINQWALLAQFYENLTAALTSQCVDKNCYYAWNKNNVINFSLRPKKYLQQQE